MKELFVPYLGNLDGLPADWPRLLEGQRRHGIDQAPWPAFPLRPSTHFSIAYADSYIFLRYSVTEPAIRAAVTAINGTVWEDSCVEFFLCFDERGYYNLECNCIGTALLGYGADRHSRTLLPEGLVSQIKTQACIQREGKDGISWELALAVPLSVFVHHPQLQLKGASCRGNFYKCGDLLPQPHFLAWANIDSPAPDFHQPRFFGRIFFDH